MDWLLDEGKYEERVGPREGLEPGRRAAIPRGAPAPLTLEITAWILTGLLAAVLRLGGLGLRPLGEGEAEQALAAFRFTQGSIQVAPAGSLPALFSGNVALFTLLGANDWTARLWPALAGVVLALLPCVLRHRLGRGGALAASVLLAISPTAVWSARNLDGATLVATCGLALVAGLILLLDGQRRAGLYLAAVGLGLGLASGPGIYGLLLILLLFGLVLALGQRFLGKDWGWESLRAAYGGLAGDPILLRRAGLVAGAVLVLSVSAIALHPAGIGHAADLLPAWVRRLLPGSGEQPPLYLLLLLIRYELLILLFGLLEIGRWLAGRPGRGPAAPGQPAGLSHTALLAYWGAAALALALLAGHRTAGDLLPALVPLALLAGQGIERSLGWIRERVFWREVWLVAGTCLALAVFFYLQLAFAARSSGGATVSVAGVTLYATTTYLILSFVALLLLVALGAVAWYWRGSELVAAGAWLAALILLGLVTVKAMWGPSFARATDPRELLVVSDRATSPQVRLLASELAELSMELRGDAYTLPVTVDASTGPVVDWYLRHWPVTRVEALSSPPVTLAAVTLAQACTGQSECDQPAIGDVFTGQGFVLRRRWLPWGLRGQDLIRWSLFSESATPIVDREVVLWVADTRN
jgi:uncharacterized protein (TIGR03663 family)